MRARNKIPLDNFLHFDLVSPGGYSYVIISCDETTRGVQTKARTELGIHIEARAELPRHHKLQRGSNLRRCNRNNDLAKILSVFHPGRRLDCRGARENFLRDRDG